MTSPLKGDRVRCVLCTDLFTKIRPGDEGTVSFVDSIGTVHVDWDNGSKLGLIPGVDVWEVIRCSFTMGERDIRGTRERPE